MHARVQRLHAAIHDLRRAGELRDVGDGQARLADRLGRASSGEQVHIVRDEHLSKVDEALQRTHASGVLQRARRRGLTRAWERTVLSETLSRARILVERESFSRCRRRWRCGRGGGFKKERFTQLIKRWPTPAPGAGGSGQIGTPVHSTRVAHGTFSSWATSGWTASRAGGRRTQRLC